MLVNKNLVNEMLEVVAEKAQKWNAEFPQLKFDKFGRVKIGEMKALNEVNAEQYFTGTSYSFDRCFDKYLEVEEKRIRIDNGCYRNTIGDCSYLSLSDIVENFFHFENIDTGKKVKIKASKVLAKVQEYWLKENSQYTKICNEMKALRNEGADFSTSEKLRELNDEKSSFERSNMYFQNQRFTNECKGQVDVMLTINPLDLLVSSGATGELNPTGFSTCWSTKIERCEDDGELSVTKYGCYSKPKAQVELGKMINRGMIYIANGRTTDIADTDYKFIGYRERISVWMDKGGLFPEVAYPSKSNEVRDKFINILLEKDIDLLAPEFDGNFDFIPFEIQDKENIENYLEYGGLFLDRVCINSNEELCYMSQPRIDYEYENPDRIPEGEGKKCSCCGDVHNESEMYLIDDEWYCDECRCNNFIFCEHCNQWVREEDAVKVGDLWYCETCADIVGYKCEECGEWHKNNDTNYANKNGNEVHVCNECLENYYEWCDTCHEYNHCADMKYIESIGESVCETCLDDYFDECVDCGEYYKTEDLNDDMRCKDCQDELEAEQELEEVVVEDMQREFEAVV